MCGRALVSVIALLLATACGTTSPTPTQPQGVADKSEPPPAAPVPTPTHTLTMTASASCTALPAAAMKRTYPVQVQEKSDATIVVLVVSSVDMVGWAGRPGFTGSRQGNTVRFEIVNDVMDAPYSMVERIPGVGDMGYFGTATGTIDDERNIVASFEGEYRLGYGSGPVLCSAPDHHIELTRIGS